MIDYKNLHSKFRCILQYEDDTEREITDLILTISPLAFFSFFSCFMKYQNRDLAEMGSGAKILILYNGGIFDAAFGSLLPVMQYSFN